MSEQLPTQRATSGGGQDSRALTILILGVLSLFACQVLGPIAWWLCSQYEADCRANNVPIDQQATIGKVFAIIGTVFLVMIALAFVAYIAFFVLYFVFIIVMVFLGMFMAVIGAAAGG